MEGPLSDLYVLSRGLKVTECLMHPIQSFCLHGRWGDYFDKSLPKCTLNRHRSHIPISDCGKLI